MKWFWTMTIIIRTINLWDVWTAEIELEGKKDYKIYKTNRLYRVQGDRLIQDEIGGRERVGKNGRKKH